MALNRIAQYPGKTDISANCQIYMTSYKTMWYQDGINCVACT